MSNRDNQIASHRSAPTSPEGVQASRRVLLYVEDHPMNLRLMQQILALRKDLELCSAPTAEAGIAMARAQPPALVLMDINLPGLDGYAALALLKADPATFNIPVMAVSANAMKGDRERGLAAGFADYITKPLDVTAFLQRLEAMLPTQGAW